MTTKLTRHVRLPAEGYRQTTKEIVVQASQMSGVADGCQATPTLGVFSNSPYQSYDPVTIQGICCDIKLPLDRVMGTPVKFYFVYYIPTGPGGGTIVWRLDYLIRRLGGNINTAMTTRTVHDAAPAAYLIAQSDKLEFAGWEIDWYQQVKDGQPVDMQLGIIRWAGHPADTEVSAACLLKLIMAYTAYT